MKKHFSIKSAFNAIIPLVMLALALTGCSKTTDSMGSLLALLGGDRPYTQTVGPEGGTVTDPDGGQVIIPAGALAEDTEITIQTYQTHALLNGEFGVTPFFGGVDFGPDDTAFSVPVTIRIPTDLKLAPGETRSLFLYNKTTSRWVETACTAEVDGTGTYLVAQVDHFCTYASGLFPMDFYGDFMYFFNGTNMDFALQAFANVFCKVTGLNMGQTFEANGKYYVVQGINFDVQYSIAEPLSETSPEASLEVGTFIVSSANSYAIQSRAYDYMNSGGQQIEYVMQVTVCFVETAAPVGGLSISVYQPNRGKVVVDSEAIRTVVNQTAGSAALTKVEFYVNDSLIGERTTAPFDLAWNTTSLADGAYRIKAKAYNAAAAIADSQEVIVQKGTADKIPPEPFVLSNLNMTELKARSLKLKWYKAADETTAQSALQYLLMKSTSPNIATVSDALANGTIVKAWTTNLAEFEVASLTPQTQYYFNLLVRDDALNVAAYTMCSAKTFPLATGLSFTDTDATIGTVSGNIVFNKVTDESEIHDYVVYFGKNLTEKYSTETFAVVPKTGAATYTVAVPAGTAKALEALTLMVFTRKEVSPSVYEESTEPACCPFKDKGMKGVVLQAVPANIAWDPVQFPPDSPGMTPHYSCDINGSLHPYILSGDILTFTHTDENPPGSPCASCYYWGMRGYLWDGSWYQGNKSGALLKTGGSIGTLPGTYKMYWGHRNEEGVFHVDEEEIIIAEDGSWTYTDPHTGETSSGTAVLYGNEGSHAYFMGSPFMNGVHFFWGSNGAVCWHDI